MVFTSLPIYPDPPNWNQPNQQMNINPPSNSNEMFTSSSSMITSNNNQPPPQNPNPNPRPGSMSEQARIMKIPQPSPALKCPRCVSTNTKFCYFNNYSLSQPRHFCKTCRRYWTCGGALRSVPVGGGCRRNKQSSKKLQGGGTNKNPTSANSSSCSSTTTSSGSTVIPYNVIAANPQMNFLSSLHPFGDLGLNFTSMPQPMDGGGDYQLEMHQYPFLGGINYPNFNGESSTSESGGELGLGFHLPMKVGSSGNISSGLITQMTSVKMEDGVGSSGLPREYLGMASGNDQYLGGGWVGDLSGFNSSSMGNML